MNVMVNRFFSEKHNPVDILIIDGKNRAIVTQIAVFDNNGKMTHCEWILVSHRHHKEHLHLIEDNTQPNDIFKAIDELNINKRIKLNEKKTV